MMRTRRRTAGIVALAALIIVSGIVTWLLRDQSNTTPLDPDNVGRSGSRALVRVLEGQGVRVTTARSTNELLAARIDRDTTVVVARPDHVTDQARERTRQALAGAGSVLWLGPRKEVGGITPVTDPGDPGPDCNESLLRGLRPPERSQRYEFGDQWRTCWSTRNERAQVAAYARTGNTVVIGNAAFVSNAAITEADHAAIALRLAGQHSRVVWWMPDAQEIVPGSGEDLAQRGPAPFEPTVALLIVALGVLAVARGRRLGRLAREPMPVIVRADETTRSRGRFYQHARDLPHTLAQLQAGTRRRLARRLGLPTTVDRHTLVEAIAARTDGDPRQIDALLHEPPATPDELLARAQQLAQLEREVRP